METIIGAGISVIIVSVGYVIKLVHAIDRRLIRVETKLEGTK